MIDIVVRDERFARKIESLAREANDAVNAEVRDAGKVGLEQAKIRARLDHTHVNRTFELDGSIDAYVTSESDDGVEGVLEATANHASFIEEGTEAHRIEAGEGGVLHWIDRAGESRFARSVNHPGTPPMPFLQPAADSAEDFIVGRLEARLPPRLNRILGSE